MKKVKFIKTLTIATPVILTPLVATSCSSNGDGGKSSNPNDVFAVKELNAALKQQFGSAEFEKVVSDTRENNNAGAFSYTKDISYFVKEIYENAIAIANISTDKPKGFNSDIINNVKITAGVSGAVNIKHSEDTAGPSGKWEITAYPTFIASGYPKSNGTLYYNMIIDKYALNNQSFDFALRPGFTFFSKSSESLDIGPITRVSTGDNGNIIAIASIDKFAYGIWNAKRNDYDYKVVLGGETNHWTACKVINKNSIVFGSAIGSIALGTYDVKTNKFTFKFEKLSGATELIRYKTVSNITINKADPSEFFISAQEIGLYKYSVTSAGVYKFEQRFRISQFNNHYVTASAGTVDNGKYLYVGTGRSNINPQNGGVYMLDLTNPTDNAQKFDWTGQEGATNVSQFDRIYTMHIDASGNVVFGFTPYNIGPVQPVYSNRGILFGYRTGKGYGPSSYKWTYNTLNNSSVVSITSFTYSDQSEKLVLATGNKIFYSTVNDEQETVGTFTEYTNSGTYNDLIAGGDNPNVYSLDFFKDNNNYYLYAGSANGLFISRTYNRS